MRRFEPIRARANILAASRHITSNLSKVGKIRDLAREAGLSIATVSRVVNGATGSKHVQETGLRSESRGAGSLDEQVAHDCRDHSDHRAALVMRCYSFRLGLSVERVDGKAEAADSDTRLST